MSSSITVPNKAAVIPTKCAHPFSIVELPIPTPKPREVLIRNHAVAINPADAIIQSTGILWSDFPVITGSDVAGEVVAVGSDVTAFAPGDRVMACMERGGFKTYSVADHTLVAKIPARMAWTEACVLPLGLVTAMMGCFHPLSLGLDTPDMGNEEKGKVVVIWGASSSVGSCAVQIVRAAGYEVVATAGANNSAYCKDLGASHVFDHRSETVVQDVISYVEKTGKTFAGIHCAIIATEIIAKCVTIADRLGKDERSRTVSTVMAPGMPYDHPLPDGVTLDWCAAIADIVPDSVLGQCMGYPTVRPNGVAEAIWRKWLPNALEDGSMRCKPDPEIIGKGVESLQTACDRMAQGVSATKLVVVIE